MRPLKLHMTAFGPFAQKQSIDFTLLGENPLFLINGATGSGKTTILDALCFSLYGQTTGAEREGRQMRCDYAAEDLMTEVELVFELNGKHYRIHRVPEQNKPRKRGASNTADSTTGGATTASETVLHKPTATLYEIVDGEDHLLANKVTDATRLIEQITGLEVKQFRQVMVLPQGKFRELLMADSADREQIFSQLFQTHIYERIQDQLGRRAKSLRIAVAKLRENQNGILQSVKMESLDELDNALQKQKIVAETSQQEFQQEQAAHLSLSQDLHRMETLEQQFIELEKQLKDQQQLDARKKDIEQLRKKIRHAEIAERLRPIYQEWQRSQDEQKTVAQDLQQAQGVFQQQEKELQEIEQQILTLPEQQTQLEAVQKEYIELSALEKRAEQLDACRRGSELQKHQRNAQQDILKKHNQAGNELADQRKKSEEKYQKLSARQANEAELKTTIATLQTQLQMVEERDSTQQLFKTKQQELSKLAEQGKNLKNKFEDAETLHKKLELQWHQAQAAILAKDLKQNEECPVCGSTSHPKLAHLEQHNIPSDQQREQAKDNVEKLRNQVNTARDDYVALNTQLKEIEERYQQLLSKVGAEGTVQALSRQLVDRQKELKTWEQQQVELAQLTKKLDACITQEKEQAKVFEQQKLTLAELQTKYETSKVLVVQAERELPEAYRESGVLAQELQEKQNTQQQLQQAIGKVREQQIAVNKSFESAKTSVKVISKNLLKCQERCEKADMAWQQSLETSPFTDHIQYEKALCDETQRNKYKTDIELFDQQTLQLQGAIVQQQTMLKGQTRPELAPLILQLEQQQLLAEKKEAESQQANIYCGQLEQAQKTILDISSQQQSEEDTYKIVGTLADVANGKTGNKISLQRFVLGVLLDDVLIAASQRLTRMSKGRYQLLRKEERSKGNKASGLELEVADGYTGKTRPVATLSGGESFIASLSLALGLSEVVQAYAGGVHLDTLFVDEGFGSLDADSLDIAIRTLIDLRETGRMVGIISHVSELKEQIGQCIDIVSKQNGSEINVVM